jgi:hypothetical protein
LVGFLFTENVEKPVEKPYYKEINVPKINGYGSLHRFWTVDALLKSGAKILKKAPILRSFPDPLSCRSILTGSSRTTCAIIPE